MNLCWPASVHARRAPLRGNPRPASSVAAAPMPDDAPATTVVRGSGITYLHADRQMVQSAHVAGMDAHDVVVVDSRSVAIPTAARLSRATPGFHPGHPGDRRAPPPKLTSLQPISRSMRDSRPSAGRLADPVAA